MISEMGACSYMVVLPCGSVRLEDNSRPGTRVIIIVQIMDLKCWSLLCMFAFLLFICDIANMSALY